MRLYMAYRVVSPFLSDNEIDLGQKKEKCLCRRIFLTGIVGRYQRYGG
jgi:hypothetical protein